MTAPNGAAAFAARERLLDAWVSRVLGAPHPRSFASDDASFRRYFRVTTSAKSFILMDAPPAQENSRPFVHLAAQLRALGLNTPAVFAIDLAAGFLLLEDFGTTTLFDALDSHAERVPVALDEAMDSLATMQRAGVPSSMHLPRYDETAVRRELSLFPEWFIGKHLGLAMATSNPAWVGACDFLVKRWLAMPAGVVHRDFHTRNLMFRPGKPLGIIDFQDACHGPVAYDVVSLVKDCYVVWDGAQSEVMLQGYYDKASLPRGYSLQAFREDVTLCGIQRHLKVAGIFSRLCHRDNKVRYLDDLPRVVAYLQDAIARFASLAPLAEWLPDESTLLEARRCAQLS
ncbi:MAG: phosphotransferase [Pseudomonadota bacterium]